MSDATSGAAATSSATSGAASGDAATPPRVKSKRSSLKISSDVSDFARSSANRTSELKKAVSFSSLKQLEGDQAQAADFKSRNKGNRMTLRTAARLGNVDDLRRLIYSDVKDLSAADEHGVTALHIACGSRNADVVAFLLREGADITRVDINGDTPLHLASFIGDVPIVEMLLAAGAELDAADSEGRTALFA
eukprot:4344135-Prymnesium_polylepis.1